jgi:hypothetical protein
VFDTKKEMYAFYDEYAKHRVKDELSMELSKKGGFNGHRVENNYAAMCIPYVMLKRNNLDGPIGNDIGIVIFYKGRLGAGIVAHEMGHAALHYDREVNGNKNAEYGNNIGEKEEDMLHALFHLVRNFTRKCYKLGIY